MTTTKNSHPLSHELQSTVAKLLATENITVTRGSYSTAWFDIKNRVLGLPVLKGETANTVDLMIGHEVGHALFTPTNIAEEWKARLPDVPFSVCNILEDVRIEREIRLRYPGLIKSFRAGYSDLWDAGFFGDLTEEKFSGLGLVDRINLKAKIPTFEVPFEADEVDLVNECLAVETAEDVYRLGRKLADFVNNKKKEEEESGEGDEGENSESNEGDPNEGESNEDKSPETDGNDDSSSGDGPNPNEEDNDDSSSDESDSGSGDNDDSPSDDEPEPENSDSGETGANGFDDDDEGDGEPDPKNDYSDEDESENTESETPKNDGSKANDGSESNDESDENPISEEARDELVSELERALEDNIARYGEDLGGSYTLLEPSREKIRSVVTLWDEVVEARRCESVFLRTKKAIDGPNIRNEYNTFLRESKSKVAAFRREFEQKKAAVENVRAATAATGKIDVNRLHRYKFDDNIFATHTRVANSKSHGMVFLVDFSESMTFTLKGIVKHTLNLVDFCRKSGIPYKVYTFTADNNDRNLGKNKGPEGEISLAGLKINEVLSSDMSKAIHREACYDLFLMSIMARSASRFTRHEFMGITPLNESLYVCHYLVKDFVRKHKVEVPTFMLLSDGMGAKLAVSGRHGNIGYGRICGGSKTEWDVKDRYDKAMIRNLKEVTGVNTICFFVSMIAQETRRQFERYIAPDSSDTEIRKAIRNFNKESISVSEGTRGFDRYVLVDDSKVVNGSDDDAENFGSTLSDDAKAAEVARAFKSNRKASKTTKVFVRELVDSICKNL